jgi:hypothetical protein
MSRQKSLRVAPAPAALRLLFTNQAYVPRRNSLRKWFVSAFFSLSHPTRRSGACARSLIGLVFRRAHEVVSILEA